MICAQDEIVYQNKLYKVYDLLRQFDLSIYTYYAKRNSGCSIEEAFQHCIEVKKKQDNCKDKNVLEIAKTSGFSKKVFYEGFYQEKTVEEIVEEQQVKKEEKETNLNYLYKIGMPKEYTSLTAFCKTYGLNKKQFVIIS